MRDAAPDINSRMADEGSSNPPASGRIVLRMPATLHNELRRMAIQENVSINHLICASLAGAMRWRAPDLDMRALSRKRASG